MTIIFAITCIYLIGYAVGRASVARAAARELRELQLEFDALSREARELQVRAETLADLQVFIGFSQGYFGRN